jgi:hypothetical protein
MTERFFKLYPNAFSYIGVGESLTCPAKMKQRNFTVFMAIAQSQRQSGITDITYEQIMKATGIMNQNSISRSIKELSEFEYEGKPILKVVRDGKRNLYSILDNPIISVWDNNGKTRELLTNEMIDDTNETRVIISNKKLDNTIKTIEVTSNKMIDTIDIKQNRLNIDKNINKNNSPTVNKKDLHSVNKKSIPSNSKPKKNANTLLSYFCKKYEEKYGFKYKPTFGKDNALMKRLLAERGDYEECCLLIDTIIKHYDTWSTNKTFKLTPAQLRVDWIVKKAEEEMKKNLEEKSQLEKNVVIDSRNTSDALARIMAKVKGRKEQ